MTGYLPPSVCAYTLSMVRWKLILALALVLWLPVQGIASVAMPFCRHAEGADVAPPDAPRAADHAPAVHVGDSEHCHPSADGEHDSRAGDHSFSFSCNDCGACHLACAPAMTSALWDALALPATSQRIAVDPSSPLTFVPEQPKRPPLRG